MLVLAERAGAQVYWPQPADSLEGARDVQVPLAASYESLAESELRAAARELSGRMPR